MNSDTQTPTQAPSDFESTLSELEKVVAELDSDVKLEHALDLFERGMKLSSTCRSFLELAEQKIEVLKRCADGTLALEPLKVESQDLD